MEEMFKAAKKNSLIFDVAEELETLWKSYGSPEENSDEGGISTEVKGFVPYWLDTTDDWFVGVTEDKARALASEYNNALEILLNLTGIWNVGGNLWYTYYYKSKERENYEEDAWSVAMSFLSTIMIDRFWDMQ